MAPHSKGIFGVVLLTGVLCTQPVNPAATKAVNARRPLVTDGILSAKTERIAPNREALLLATKPEVGSRLKLYDTAGQEVTVVRTLDGTIRAEIDPRRGYVIAPPIHERRPLPKDGLEFPARYVTFAVATGTGAVTRTNLGGLFLRPSGVPLTWNEQLKAYATDLFVGYEFEDGREIALPVQRTVTFFAEGANARIVEDRLTIERSGASGYKRVRLTTAQTEGETHFTARVGPLDEMKSSVTVLREAAGIKLDLPSPELPAFGVGSGTLTVSLQAKDGMPLAAPRPLEVLLAARRLHLPASVVIETGRSSAQAEFRSTGIGGDQIVAQAGVFRAEFPVNLVFPVVAIVASFAGGALGGVVRYLRNRSRRSGLLVRRVFEGMLVGLILVGAAWAGLVGFEMGTGVLGTPFGAFILAALSGYLGCAVLDRVAGKALGGAKESG